MLSKWPMMIFLVRLLDIHGCSSVALVLDLERVAHHKREYLTTYIQTYMYVKLDLAPLQAQNCLLITIHIPQCLTFFLQRKLFLLLRSCRRLCALNSETSALVSGDLYKPGLVQK